MTAKRFGCVILALALALSACGGSGAASGAKASSGPASAAEAAKSSAPAKGGDAYPRNTYLDGDPESKWLASLQNSHLLYEYGEDWNDGNGVVFYPFEFLCCENYCYMSGCTAYGYECARKQGDAPDLNCAFVIEGDEMTYYDFAEQYFVRGLSIDDMGGIFYPPCPETTAFNTYRETLRFEDDAYSNSTEQLERLREPLSVFTLGGVEAKGYRLKSRYTFHGKKDHVSEYLGYVFHYDPKTEVTLHGEFYLDDYPKWVMDDAAGELYPTIQSMLFCEMNVTSYELGRVSPDDVLKRIEEARQGLAMEELSLEEYYDRFA